MPTNLLGDQKTLYFFPQNGNAKFCLKNSYDRGSEATFCKRMLLKIQIFKSAIFLINSLRRFTAVFRKTSTLVLIILQTCFVTFSTILSKKKMFYKIYTLI